MAQRFLIEGVIPRELSQEAAREKAIRHGHISTLHVWWARRPLVVARAAVLGALLAEDAQVDDKFIANLCQWEVHDGDPTPLVLIGALGLVLPLAQSRYFFPLVWLAFTLLLEPLNHALGAPSLLGDWQQGNPRRLYLLLTAGLICGLLWELWNFWAVSKWIYTVPLVGGLKVFEMPLLGFLGFPPFAVQCYVMVNFLSLFRGGRSWERLEGPAIALRLPLWLGLLISGGFCLLMFHQIDTHTVLNFLPPRAVDWWQRSNTASPESLTPWHKDHKI